MRTLRRFLAVFALMFWQGGFLFYVSVVVPVGTEILGSALRQGFITREVTRQLNLAAGISLVLIAWDVLACRDPVRWRYRLRAGLWLFLAACQGGLFYLHDWLDALLVPRGMIVLDHARFYLGHRIYLWLHTLQWAAGLLFVVLMLASWRCEDGGEWEENVKSERIQSV